MKFRAICISSLLIGFCMTVWIFPWTTSAGQAPAYDSSLFADSPESRAIEVMLLAEEKYDVLRTGSMVLVNSRGDFATGMVGYKSGDDPAEYNVYLLKENDAWTAYPVLPAGNDHPGVFYWLAENYCRDTFSNFQGMGYADDSWQGKDASRRVIHFKCSELVNNEWQDHDVSLVYERNEQQQWRITGEAHPDSAPQEKVGSALSGQGRVDTGEWIQEYRLHLAATLAPSSPDNEKYALQLVRDGADVNLQDEYGRTPLHILCSTCLSPQLIQALIDAGADVNIRTAEGHSPLDLVTMMMNSGQPNDCGAIREMLVKAGAE